MLKKSKVIAVLSVCVMMFAVVQPALARSWEQVGEDTVVGAGTGGAMVGILAGLFAGAVVVATGGLAALPMAGAAIGEIAATGAACGAIGGGVAGAVAGKEGVEQYVQDVGKNFSDEMAKQTR